MKEPALDATHTLIIGATIEALPIGLLAFVAGMNGTAELKRLNVFKIRCPNGCVLAAKISAEDNKMKKRIVLLRMALFGAEMLRVAVVSLWPMAKAFVKLFVGMFFILYLISFVTGTETNALPYFGIGIVVFCLLEVGINKLARIRFI